MIDVAVMAMAWTLPHAGLGLAAARRVCVMLAGWQRREACLAESEALPMAAMRDGRLDDGG
jgi:hypothetical protein